MIIVVKKTLRPTVTDSKRKGLF